MNTFNNILFGGTATIILIITIVAIVSTIKADDGSYM